MLLCEDRYSEASDVYRQIIDHGDNIRNSVYQLLLNTQNDDNSEYIFSVQFLGGQAANAMPQHAYPAVSGGWHFYNPLGSLADSYGFDDGTPLSYDDPRFNYDNMGENRDPRFRYNFLWDGCT